MLVATSIWASTHGMVTIEISLFGGSSVGDALFAEHRRAVERAWFTEQGLAAAALLDEQGEQDPDEKCLGEGEAVAG